ncbi:hypothetical protein GIB67_011085 [Kingdonia uniflora]|uniref:Protein TIC 20 n=1 Tax=Kingdonia uniflora TaxID=39325 RepID=A0A7J7LKE6_9MAGN|nr:hypothetical protein GIB67_011085 [Kingdonia uniflora]
MNTGMKLAVVINVIGRIGSQSQALAEGASGVSRVIGVDLNPNRKVKEGYKMVMAIIGIDDRLPIPYDELELHLTKFGFLKTYTVWNYHGEDATLEGASLASPSFSPRCEEVPVDSLHEVHNFILHNLDMNIDGVIQDEPNVVPESVRAVKNAKEGIGTSNPVDEGEGVCATPLHVPPLNIAYEQNIEMECFTISSLNLPWLIIGDFNIISTLEEKMGGIGPLLGAIKEFNDFINNCKLLDSPSPALELKIFTGNPFQIVKEAARLKATLEVWRKEVQSHIRDDISTCVADIESMQLQMEYDSSDSIINIATDKETWNSCHVKLNSIIRDFKWDAPTEVASLLKDQGIDLQSLIIKYDGADIVWSGDMIIKESSIQKVFMILLEHTDPMCGSASLLRSIPYASFVAFFALYLGVVRNPSFTRVFSPGSGVGLRLLVTGYNAIFVFIVMCFGYSLGHCIVGRTPYLPFVADAADRQL